MCGIVGHAVSEGGCTEKLDEMLNVLKHRGPDEKGIWRSGDNRIGLGNCRLKIIDLVGGKQPMFNEDQSIVVIFNGCIYNF